MSSSNTKRLVRGEPGGFWDAAQGERIMKTQDGYPFGFGRAVGGDQGSVKTTGHAHGMPYVHTDGVGADALYVNVGDESAASWAPVSLGVAGTVGKRIASGVAAVTGTLAVVTGLTLIEGVTLGMAADASLTNGTSVTYTFSAGTVTIKVWKPTANNDTTPVASAAAVNVAWMAFGT